MTHNEPETLEQLEANQARIKQALAETEEHWKNLRAESRNNCIRMITEFHISAARAALLSGHHRTSITNWLDVWNAENRSAQRAAAEAGAQGKNFERSAAADAPYTSGEITPL